ncbi:ribonuclease H protein, partial [Trifolium medium]|nr:ribonuclease H protein [Trifolium medium]
WSIGDGSKIKVMEDPWLRDLGRGWVRAPQPQAEEILAVPLFGESCEDRLVWKEEHNGEYTVKSGYKLLMKEKEEGRRRGLTGSWKELWQIQAPPKTKHLIWRICRDCLPTRTQLRQHHVSCPAACELCSRYEEDTWHVLFECEESKNCWLAAGLQHIIAARLQAFNSVRDVIFDICSSESKEIAGRMAMMIWDVLWNNRNQWLWNHEKKDATQLGVHAFQMWDDWNRAQCNNNNSVIQEQVQHQQRWLPPRQGWLKCNVDAGFSNNGRITSGGWCIRDETGQFIRAGTHWFRGAYSIIEAEA